LAIGLEIRSHKFTGGGWIEDYGNSLLGSPTNPRNVMEIRRPICRGEAGTSWVKARFVSQGIMKTVPLLAIKSVATPFRFVVTRRNRKILSSPNEMVTMGVPGIKLATLSR
jgi:hypothetical protein